MGLPDSPLIATIVLSLVLACFGGLAARAVRLPPIVGYLLAGIVVGPFTPGIAVDPNLTGQLAEIGVMLLLFGSGLHVSLRDLAAVRSLVLPGALLQIAIATALGAGVVALTGLEGVPWVIGFELAVASTAVALRMLEARGTLHGATGRVALGWLVVQDIVVVLGLVMLPVFARGNSHGLAMELGLAALRIVLFCAAALLIGTRLVPWLLARVARTGSRELFTLSVIGIALGIAMGASAGFGVSLALGAFLAGVVLSESDLSHQAAADALPLQDVFAVLFFVSVGMLFDPAVLTHAPVQVLVLTLAVFIGNGLVTLLLLLALRAPVRLAGDVAASLAQIGEFSFVLTALAAAMGLLPPATRDVIVAAAMLTIIGNAAVGPGLRWLALRLGRVGWIGRWIEGAPTVVEVPRGRRGHAVLVGYGRVGSVVGTALATHNHPYAVIEQDRRAVERLRVRGVDAVWGDAARESVLAAADIDHARLLVIATPDPFQARRMIELARAANPAIDTVVRTHTDEEIEYLRDGLGVGLALMGEREIALGIGEYALRSLGLDGELARATIDELRDELAGAKASA
jgi:monovalent cation:H+ antiporter-2, CPA2 family